MTLDQLKRLQGKAGRKVKAVEHDRNSDLALVVAYKNGDEEAGLKLMESYLDIISIVYKYPSKPPFKSAKMSKLHYSPLTYEDKEDLFQEIMAHFFKLVNEFDPALDKPFEHMIRAKLHQRVFNNFFSEFIEIETHETEFDDDLDFECKANSILLDESITEKLPEQYIELYQAFNQLGARQRQVMEMSVVKGWNSKEIAEELGITPSTVRVTLKKALESVRATMKTEEV
ncbi:RNA polymerase sigma factor [Bacillus phage vB_BpsS-36]|uniref:RNA polymerase sigma factor n=1 Tax=Bacillus phage vB_BpsS-36 TaxID=2419622 RepID=A0A3G3BX07_9CAUD|nr:RNA polymerase sigma factor [Bacillus phage vB_BpsS-36]